MFQFKQIFQLVDRLSLKGDYYKKCAPIMRIAYRHGSINTSKLFQLQKRHAKCRQHFVKSGFKELGFLTKKHQHFVHFEPYDLLQIWPAGSPNTYQTMYYGVSICNGSTEEF